MSTIATAPVLRHGVYLCLRWAAAPPADTGVVALAEGLGFRSEFEASGHPADAYALLRRIDAVPGDIHDDGLLHADAVVHVASAEPDRVEEFCSRASPLLTGATVSWLRGVVRPTNFTGRAMHEFAYASQLEQHPGPLMPHAFLLPLCKTPEWWAKSWMERHTYFLPRYDDEGRMLSEGHALAAVAGIAQLMRRTYRHASEPAPEGTYDFVNYFECAERGVAAFHAVCAALRDVSRNPEWRFVREGPTWHGRRVRTWSELSARRAAAQRGARPISSSSART